MENTQVMEIVRRDASPEVEEGNQIVRTFTGSLDETSTLAVWTKEAQRDIDALKESRAKARQELLVRESEKYLDQPIEAALLKGLERASDTFFRSIEAKQTQSRFPRFWKKKQSTKSQVEQKMRQSNFETLEDVKELVGGMADEWKASHGKAYNTFDRMCKSLDSHSILFKSIPSQNTYVSVLAGSLSMVVQAAVYHSEIAENLATATADLCERVASCARLVKVIKDNAMQGDLGRIYEQLFLFLLTAAEWFNKSQFYRFLDSFNTAVKEEHEAATNKINGYIIDIFRKGEVEGLASIEDIRHTSNITDAKLDKIVIPGIAFIANHLESHVDESRRQNQFQQHQDGATAGHEMRNMFLGLMKSEMRNVLEQELHAFARSYLVADKPRQIEVIEEHTPSKNDLMLTREQTFVECRRLRPLVYGSDGIGLADESDSLRVDMEIIGHLALWIQEAAGHSRKLWISFPFEYEEDTPARAAALSIISVVAKANAPFVSYLCRQPRRSELTETQSSVDAGLLSMVYSLILQLLRFRPNEDLFRYDTRTLTGLNGNISSWKAALAMLDALLRCTPIVRYCIIHGLDELESDFNAAARCKELLTILFTQSRQPGNPFSILLTTSGDSMSLYQVTQQTERVSSDEDSKRLKKSGVWLDLTQI